jgi:hypothetical protein
MIRQFPFFLSLLLSLSLANTSFAVDPVKNPPSSEKDNYVFQEGPMAGLTLEEVLTTDYKTLRQKTGKKLNFVQRMGLKMVQKRYRKISENPRKAEKLEKRLASANTLGLVGIILGAVGLAFAFVPFIGFLSPFLAFTAIILGAIGLKKDNRPGLAIGALVLGSLTLLLFVVALVILL